jgi:hypothetical protein
MPWTVTGKGEKYISTWNKISTYTIPLITYINVFCWLLIQLLRRSKMCGTGTEEPIHLFSTHLLDGWCQKMRREVHTTSFDKYWIFPEDAKTEANQTHHDARYSSYSCVVDGYTVDCFCSYEPRYMLLEVVLVMFCIFCLLCRVISVCFWWVSEFPSPVRFIHSPPKFHSGVEMVCFVCMEYARKCIFLPH